MGKGHEKLSVTQMRTKLVLFLTSEGPGCSLHFSNINLYVLKKYQLLLKNSQALTRVLPPDLTMACARTGGWLALFVTIGAVLGIE